MPGATFGTADAITRGMLKQKEILKNRAEAKTKELEARLANLKADAREGASDEIERIRTSLDDLAEAARAGWDNLTESLARRVNTILDARN